MSLNAQRNVSWLTTQGSEKGSLIIYSQDFKMVALIITAMLVVRLCVGNMSALIHCYPTTPVRKSAKERHTCQQPSVLLPKEQQKYPLLEMALPATVFVCRLC